MDSLKSQTPLQTPIQTPLPGTADIYNIPTGPTTEYPASDNGGGGPGTGNAEPKSGRPSPYMVNPMSHSFLIFLLLSFCRAHYL